MTLQKNVNETSEKKSMIELAEVILTDEKNEMAFKELFDQVATMKDLTDAQRNELLSRFYTDLNLDGRFMALGSNVWGLKRWYPAKQTTEKSLAASRKREQEELEEADLEEELFDEELDLDEDEEVDDEEFGFYEEAGFEVVEEG